MRLPVGIAVVALLAAGAAGWSAVRFGIGVSPDSAHYIGAARSLASGHGLRFNGVPFTHWPPLYSLLLAGFGGAGIDPLGGARPLAILLYAVNAALFCCLAYRMTGGRGHASIGAGLLFLASPEMLHIHTMAWSEPLFLCCTFASLLLFSRWGAIGGTWRLAAAGACVAAALLTRYAGVALLPPFLVSIVFARPKPCLRPVREAVGFLCIAALPLAAWLLVLRTLAHAASDRPLAFHPPGIGAIALVAAAGVAAELARRLAGAVNDPSHGRSHPVGTRRPPDANADTVPAPIGAVPGNETCGLGAAKTVLSLWMLAFLSTYCAFVFLSICLLDALTPLDGRILSPALLAAGLLALQWIWSHSRRDGKDSGNGASGVRPWQWLVAGGLIVACGRGGSALSLARQRHDTGYGYTSRAWRSSPTLAWIESLPRGITIYSNAPDLIAFRCNRVTLPLPTKFSPTSLQPNAHLENEIDALNADLRNGALVVTFPGSPRSYLLSEHDLERACHVPQLFRFADGTVYGFPKSSVALP